MQNVLGQLRGKHILVAESEHLIARDIQNQLRRHGAVVVGPVRSLASGVALLRWHKIDAVIVDIDLDAQISFSLAEEIERKHIPYLFACLRARAPSDRWKASTLGAEPAPLSLIAEELFGTSRHR